MYTSGGPMESLPSHWAPCLYTGTLAYGPDRTHGAFQSSLCFKRVVLPTCVLLGRFMGGFKRSGPYNFVLCLGWDPVRRPPSPLKSNEKRCQPLGNLPHREAESAWSSGLAVWPGVSCGLSFLFPHLLEGSDCPRRPHPPLLPALWCLRSR